jgi:hypothetical protein
LKKVVAPLEEGKEKLIVINDIMSVCLEKKLKLKKKQQQ